MIEKENQNSIELSPGKEKLFDYVMGQTRSITAIFSAVDYSVKFVSGNIEELLGVEKEDFMDSILNILREVERATTPPADAPEVYLGKIKVGESVHEDAIEWKNPKTHETTYFKGYVKRDITDGEDVFFLVWVDITDEINRNRQMKEMIDAANSANHAKTSFLANMSHDFRTPMNAITNFNVLITKNSGNPQKVRDYTHKIGLACQNLLSLLNDVLDMSKIESGKTMLTNGEFALGLLLEEVNSVIAFQAKSKQQEYQVHSGGIQQDIFIGDKQKINEILVNILGNAVKYTPAGGKIDFYISEEKAQTADYWDVRFKVKDNGIGMSKEFKDTIFDAFTREEKETTKGIQGTGLGMAITKSLVQMMGGTISVDSEEGKGSTFVITLRLQGVNQDLGNFWSAHGIHRILVIDDDVQECEKIEIALHDTDVEVFFATSGYKAMHILDVGSKDGKGFDVILLGKRVGSLSCINVARKIQKMDLNPKPIVLLLTDEWEEIAEAAREAGIYDFMTKPFFMSIFQQLVEDIKNRTASVTEKKKDNPLEGMCFLAAEDNDINADILVELMSMEGAAVIRAENGAKAVEMFEKADPGFFDMILMDIQMPVMNGYDAAAAIRKLDKEGAVTIPIIAMTANAYAEDVQRTIDAGMNAHIPKPIDMAFVESTIARLKENNQST